MVHSVNNAVSNAEEKVSNFIGGLLNPSNK
jgi:hypothetical protein